jgi:hypothetical protein
MKVPAAPAALSSSGPRRVTPATLSGTVRPHPASLSAWEPRSQPDVTAINRSAVRYTCYAQRNGPTSPRLSMCLGSRSQPDVTAINRSAVRYTCYAQRNGPTPPRLSICLGTKVPA